MIATASNLAPARPLTAGELFSRIERDLAALRSMIGDDGAQRFSPAPESNPQWSTPMPKTRLMKLCKMSRWTFEAWAALHSLRRIGNSNLWQIDIAALDDRLKSMLTRPGI